MGIDDEHLGVTASRRKRARGPRALAHAGREATCFRARELLLGVAVLAGPAGAAAQEIDTLALASHTRFLAHDLLEGRGTASRGERLAALYLETRLRGLGLGPLPGGDYRLPVPLTAVHVREEGARVRIAGDGTTRTLAHAAFYHPGGNRAAFRDFAGQAVFAGSVAGAVAALGLGAEAVAQTGAPGETGASVGPTGLQDLSGKVVVVTPPWSGLEELEAELLRVGAAGATLLIPDATLYERLRIVRGPTRFFLPDGVEDPANQSHLPRVIGGPDMIRALGLEEEIDSGQPVGAARPLGLRLEVELPHALEPRTAYNVAGHVPGADPARRNEWVVYVAHYDHVGLGEPMDGDSIWNGFVDNAAGCAMLLEIARVLAADPPAASVAILFVTAEEQGLLGSNWFVHRPPIPPGRIRAVVNLDGGAPPGLPTTWGIMGADASLAGRTARRIVEERGWTVNSLDVQPVSDHWPFHRAGVPALFLFPGSTLEGLSRDEARARFDRWVHPHTPADRWSADFPFAGLARYAELALEIGRALAGRAPQR